MIIILSGDIGELGSGETRTRLYSSVTRLLPHPASCSARTEADRMGYRTKLAKLEGIKFSRFVMSHLLLRIPVLLISVGRVTFIQKVSLQLITSQFQSHYSLKVRVVVSHLEWTCFWLRRSSGVVQQPELRSVRSDCAAHLWLGRRVIGPCKD